MSKKKPINWEALPEAELDGTYSEAEVIIGIVRGMSNKEMRRRVMGKVFEEFKVIGEEDLKEITDKFDFD